MRRYLWMLICLVLTGCNLFELRDAEPPVSPPLWNNFYTTWQQTLENLQYSYNDKRNVVKYGELFTTNYRFYFSAPDISDYNVPAYWNRTQESDMLYTLHNWADSVHVTLTPIQGEPDDLQSTPIKLFRLYEIAAFHNGIVHYYGGRMELQLKQENGFWRILNWYDYRMDNDPELPSWGKLKYDFSV